MYVCGDYKLIVHGGPTGEKSHQREAPGLQAAKCRRLYIQSLSLSSPLLGLMQMSVRIKKKEEEKRKKDGKKEAEKKPFCNLFGGNKTQVPWLS